MKFRKLMTSLTAALMLAMAGVSAQAADLRVGVEGAYPPFSWKESDGTLKGFDIEIAQAICAELKRNCVLVEQMELQEQNKEIGDARREVVTMVKEAEQHKVVAVTKARRQLEVAKLELGFL